MNLVDEIVLFGRDLAKTRQEIHADPELGYEEHHTAAKVAAALEEWGLDVTSGIGGTGVVGSLRGRLESDSSAKAVGLRADMDALPLQEENTFAHASRNAGKMHACGHDGHTVMLLGAAQHLASHPDFAGTIHFIFQPAEEGGAGAQAMIDDGLFERFPCDAVFGMHNWPGLAVGQFAVTSGPMLASASEFVIQIEGRGAHAALPHEGADPVVVSCQLVQALQTVVSRNVPPVEAGVLSVTQIHTGDAMNIIPNEATIKGTVRTFSDETLALMEQRMTEIVERLPAAFGCSAKMHFKHNYPVLINHSEQTSFAQSVIADMVGNENLSDFVPSMGSEDFAFMLAVKPGCYVMIGNGEGAHRANGHGLGPCSLHNPSYDFNDELLPIGASYWVRLAHRWLANPHDKRP